MLQTFNEKNRDLIVNINGRLCHRDAAGISPFDSAVQGGDAVWEGLRLYQGRIFKLHEHLDRLERSARALSFSKLPAREKIIEEIKRTLAANDMRDNVHIRLTVSRGVKITSGMDPRLNQAEATLIVLAEHKAPVYARTGLRLITSKIRRPPPEVLGSANSSRQSAEFDPGEDRGKRCRGGRCADARPARIRRGDKCNASVRRPKQRSLHQPCCGLSGGHHPRDCDRICAAQNIRCQEKDLSLDEIYHADELFCTGTMGELAGITTVDDRQIGNGQIGEMTRRLSALYAERTQSEGVSVVD